MAGLGIRRRGEKRGHIAAAVRADVTGKSPGVLSESSSSQARYRIARPVAPGSYTFKRLDASRPVDRGDRVGRQLAGRDGEDRLGLEFAELPGRWRVSVRGRFPQSRRR